MQRLRLTVLAALLAVPVSGRAAVTEANFQLVTGNDLAALCSAAPDDKNYTAAQHFCEGFAIGVYRVLAKDEISGGLKTFCLPDPGPTRDQAKEAYVGFVGRMPAAAAAPPEDSILLFLQQTYPCGGAK